MVDFRKLLLVLVAGLLLLATAVSAADYKCTASSVPTLVRAEGLAEMVGDVKLTCSGDIPNPAAGLKLNIRATLSQNITSNLLQSSGTVTEATMVLAKGYPYPYATGPASFKGYFAASTLTPYADGSQNVYQAVKISDTEVEWQGVVLAGPNSPGVPEILLTNIRANASGAGAGSSISATINITTPTSVAIDNNSLVVANTRTGLIFSISGPVGFKSCESQSGGKTGSQCVAAETLTFSEGFNNAFRPRINNLAGTVTPVYNIHSVPAGAYADESGFNPTNFASSSLPAGELIATSSIGLANQGTRLVARIKGVTAGTSLAVPTTIVTPNGLQLRLFQFTATDFSQGYEATGSSAFPCSFPLLSSTQLYTYGPAGDVTLDASGNGVIVYEVVSYAGGTTAPSLQDDVKIPVAIAYAKPGTPTASGFTTASGSFAPISTVAVASFIAPEPRFIDSGSDKAGYTISLCRTILLFPFITNQADFDTGIIISNTTADPLKTGAQSGACVLSYYGNTNGSTGPAAQTSPVIASGGQLAYILSTGGSVTANGGGSTACASGACSAPGFQGYLFAICDFQYAHGFAYVSNIRQPYQGAMGYLPLIVPDRGRLAETNATSGSNAGEQLAQ